MADIDEKTNKQTKLTYHVLFYYLHELRLGLRLKIKDMEIKHRESISIVLVTSIRFIHVTICYTQFRPSDHLIEAISGQ